MAWQCREEIRKAKAQLEQNLAMDVKNNDKHFFRYIGKQRKMKETVPFPVSKIGDLGATNMKKNEVLNKFLPLSSMASAPATPANSQNPKAGTGRMKRTPGSRPSKEPPCAQVHWTWWDASESPDLGRDFLLGNVVIGQGVMVLNWKRIVLD